MTVWRGGRGVKAPYESTHVRVPTPIKDKVEDLVKAYKDGRIEDEKDLPSIDDAIEIARKILKSKKSAKTSLESFIKIIYDRDICL